MPQPKFVQIPPRRLDRFLDRFLVANRLAEYVDLLIELDEARSGREVAAVEEPGAD